jgi:hypothetical protein
MPVRVPMNIASASAPYWSRILQLVGDFIQRLIPGNAFEFSLHRARASADTAAGVRQIHLQRQLRFRHTCLQQRIVFVAGDLY